MPDNLNGPVPARDQLELRSAMTALAAELTSVQKMTLDLQATIGNIVVSLNSEQCDAIFRLQEADKISQTIGDLERFVSAISDTSDEKWTIDPVISVARLHLRDVADRLSCKVMDEKPQTDETNGSCELF